MPLGKATDQALANPTSLSYVFIFGLLVLVAFLGLATPLVTVLFASFALHKLDRFRRKWVAVTLFAVLVLAIFYGFAHFTRHAIIAVPKIAETSIPKIIEYAKAHGFDLPFEDIDSLKALIVDTVKDQLKSVTNFARVATKQFLFVIIGIVVAVSLFLNPKLDLDQDSIRPKNDLYAVLCRELAVRFGLLFRSFTLVMGGQLIISAINTVLTAIFVLSISLPYALIVIGITFLAGLIPIVGGLLSNTLIVGIAFTKSPSLAVAALVFLVVLHKLEYFLNSRIIGHRIRNPVWLTLLALILGERLMGVPGMILAPVILHYLKVEASQFQLDPVPNQPPQPAISD